MYENNYPNNYSNHTAEQNPVNNTTYHYESGGSFSGTNYSAGESKTAGFGGSGKKGNKGGIGKRLRWRSAADCFSGFLPDLDSRP